MPEVGEGVTEAELVKWSVEVGEVIEPDQVVCEVMTDKATMEINCPVGGTVVEVCGEEGDILPVHAALLKLAQSGAAPAPKPTAKAEAAPATSTAPAPAPHIALAPKASPAPSSAPNPAGKVLASPAVRAFAKEQGTDLQGISGTGKGGRITRDDVRSQASAAPVHTSQIKAPPAIQVQASRADRRQNRWAAT